RGDPQQRQGARDLPGPPLPALREGAAPCHSRIPLARIAPPRWQGYTPSQAPNRYAETIPESDRWLLTSPRRLSTGQRGRRCSDEVAVMKQSLQLKLGQQLTMTPQLQQAIKL